MEEEEKEEVQGEEMHCRRQETRLKVEGAISRTSTLASHANRPTTVFVFHEMHPPHSLFLFFFGGGGKHTLIYRNHRSTLHTIISSSLRVCK